MANLVYNFLYIKGSKQFVLDLVNHGHNSHKLEQWSVQKETDKELCLCVYIETPWKPPYGFLDDLNRQKGITLCAYGYCEDGTLFYTYNGSSAEVIEKYPEKDPRYDDFLKTYLGDEHNDPDLAADIVPLTIINEYIETFKEEFLEYNREKDLKEQFNQFFAQLGIEDLYSKLSNDQLIDLKKLLSCINNMITLRATDSFVLKLYQDGFIDSKEKVGIGKIVDKQHANANGYDVKYVGDKKIIAEVKCNIPVNETSFGAAQERGIIKDIEHLLDGKKKKQPIKDIADYYKFMVILDCEHAQESMEKIIKKREDVKLYTSPAELDKENVYVIYV